MVTGGNRNPLITMPYHSYYQMVRLYVVIVVIKKRELFIVVTTLQGYGVFCLMLCRSLDSQHRKGEAFELWSTFL